MDEAHLADAKEALGAFFRDDPYFMTRHHIDSYDRFVGGGLAATLRSMNPLTLLQEHPAGSGKKVQVDVFVGDKEVRVDMPTISERGGESRPMLPNDARLRDLTYAINVYADVRVEYRRVEGDARGSDARGGGLIASVPFDRPVCLGKIPLMLHSRHCLLHGLSREALRLAGECPNDRGGYFIVDGKEKVIVAREELVHNRMYVRKGEASKPDVAFIGYVRNDSPVDSFPRTSTFYVRSATAPSRRNAISVIVAHLGNVRSVAGNGNASTGEVPLFALFRALGVESDRAIMQHVVYDVDAPEEADVVEFLRSSAIEAVRVGATDQRTARALLETHVSATDTLKQILTDDLFPNAGTDFRVKALILGQTVRTIVRSALGKEDMANRDDYVNKRLDLSGFLLGDLFRDVFLRVRRQSSNRLAGEWQSGAWRTSGDVTKLVNVANLGAIFEGGMLTERLRRSMKGDWGADEEPDPESADGGGDGTDGLVQDLSRVSYTSYVSHVRRLNNPVDRSVKMAAPHELRASHWGAICPVESPDGPSVGLLNHLATTCTISMGVADTDGSRARAAIDAMPPEVAIPLSTIVERRVPLAELRGACKVLVNDTWSYVAFDPPALLARLRALRLAKSLPSDTSIAWAIRAGELHVHTDRGRFLRPLCTVDASGALPLRAAIVAAKSRKGVAIQSLRWREDLLLDSGAIELVDVEELRTLLVAMRASDCAADKRYSHCELHAGMGMLGISANTFPMMHHNMASRCVLGMAQFKQAIGTYSTAFRTRFDTLGYVLHHPQRPLVGTTVADALCAGQWAQGENVVVAICTYSGYNMEDSVLINRDSVMRGRFHMTHYESHRYEESAGDEDRPLVAFANPDALLAANGGFELSSSANKPIRASYAALGPSGFPAQDAQILEGDVVLGRVEILGPGGGGGEGQGGGQTTRRIADRSVVATRKTTGVVDRVAVYPSPLGGQARCCKVRMRQHRAPTLGDKLASRFAQKGCIGMLMPAVDMPFSASTGAVPDIIFNPHGLPTRCTVSHVIELLLAKAAGASGARYNVNSVEEPRGDPVEEAARVLERLGLQRTGDEILHNGRTGEMMQVDVYVGVNHYGRLKHMVADKYQHRLRGPVGAITRQPVKQPGAGSGGLRIGEMEQNVLLAHGMSGFLKESFSDRSDRYRATVDADEGEHAVTSRQAETARGDVVRALPGAGVMGGPPRFATVEMPYAFKVLQQELAAMAIGTKLRVEGGDEAERWFDAEDDFADDADEGDEGDEGDDSDRYSGDDGDDGEDFGDASFADAAGENGEGED